MALAAQFYADFLFVEPTVKVLPQEQVNFSVRGNIEGEFFFHYYLLSVNADLSPVML